MGSTGSASTSMSTLPWSLGYTMNRDAIESSTELWYNPDSHRILFSRGEAPVAPVLEGYLSNYVGTDTQVKERLQELWPGKAVLILRNF